MLAVHELGHVLGLDHPSGGCAVMNSRFLSVCGFGDKLTALNWVCGLVQPADLKPLQKAYGKRRSTARSGLCMKGDGDGGVKPTTPIAPASAQGVASWVATTTPAGDPLRSVDVLVTWPAYAGPKGLDLTLQRTTTPCAEFKEEEASTVFAREDVATLEPTAGQVVDRVDGLSSTGGTLCYRFSAITTNQDGVSSTIYGIPPAIFQFEVAVGPDPAPLA